LGGKLKSSVGEVKSILQERTGFAEIEVSVNEKIEKAVNYDDITGKVTPGDQVLLNTTAVKLGLGTGGYHFVQANLSHPQVELAGPGHIMKLRYTPEQIKVLSVEEEAAGFHEIFNNFKSLEGFPAVIFSLHSVLAPLVISFKLMQPQGKIAYIMTDGGALPAAFSHTISALKNAGLIQGVITCGQAFGGDLEAVNIFSALIAAKEIVKADAAVIGMGPGNVGTGTKWGFSGVQLGEAINAVNILGGRAVFCPRISFSDPRERHLGVSHHSLTVLSQVALTPALVVIPHLPEEREVVIKKQLSDAKIPEKHSIIWEYGERGWEKLQESSFSFSTMGRGINEEKEFFLGACAGGIYAGKISEQIGLN
jgi:hypothetical protein